MSARVGFESVFVRYPNQDRNAVDGATFDVPSGAFVVLLGPSGCGKSTLLRTVNRLVPLRSGRVTVGEQDVQAVEATALRRGIGYVIQAVGLFAHMTVAQNIAVVPELIHWDKARVRRRVDELLELVNLDPDRYRSRYPRQLSGGEQQRVGVARAIAAEPAVLLMDEPFGAVDAIVRASLQEETRRIARQLQTTILFVTHDVDEALRLADRIVVMREGQVVQYDIPLAILGAPATPYVEELLGTHDVVRRLGLLLVRDAMRDPSATGTDEIGENDTLRDSLGAFLAGTKILNVKRDGRTVGTLSFDDVQRALASTQSKR